MKHMSWMLVLAMLAMSPAFAAWTPVFDAEGCPDVIDEEWNPVNWPREAGMTGMPGINPAEFGTQVWQKRDIVWPNVETHPYDFCGMFDVIFCSLGPVADLLKEVAEFANLLQCMYADINGPINLDKADDLPISPNGMLDSFELAVLAALLNDETHPLHAEATAGFQEYFEAIKDMVMEALFVANLKVDDKDLRGTIYAAAPYLASSLCSVLAGFAMLGDDDTSLALDMLIGLLADIGLEPPEEGLASLGTPMPALGPNGDIDGDGFTNKQEYGYFVGGLEYSVEEYVAAALDPEAVPELPQVTIVGPDKRVVVGDNVTLTATVSIGTATDFAWEKDGVELEDEVGAVLAIGNAQLDDAGLYTAFVTVDDGAKAIDVYEGSYVLTISEFSMPAGSALGLSIFAGACALAGAMGIRRRK